MGGGGGVSTQAKNKDERAIYQRNSSACLMVGGRGDGGGGANQKTLIKYRSWYYSRRLVVRDLMLYSKSNSKAANIYTASQSKRLTMEF